MKELPYFKFYCNEWITGDITSLDYDVQGLFINLCSYYWSKSGNITLLSAKKRFKDVREIAFEELIEHQVIKVTDGNIVINFLDEQMNERGKQSNQNAVNGSKGGRPKKQIESENKPTALISLSEVKAKKSNIEEKREEEKRKEEPIDFEKLLIFVNLSFGKNFKVVSKVVKDKFKARIKEGYSNIQIKDCIDGLKNDEWHKSIGYNPVTLEYISRSATIDKYSTKSTVQPTEDDGNDDYYRNVMAQVNKYKEQ